MYIDSKKLIHGIKPVELKALLKKGTFSTPDVMIALGLWEPQASQIL